MLEAKLFLMNPHLLPSETAFFLGFLFLTAAPIIYIIRTKRFNEIIFPNIFEYNRTERTLFIAGIILTISGIFTLAYISEHYGYYYFKDGLPTFLKKQ